MICKRIAGALAPGPANANAQGAATPAPAAEQKIALVAIHQRSAPAPTLTETCGTASAHQTGELRVPKGKGLVPVIAPLLGGSLDKVPARYKAIDPLANPPRVRSVTVVTAALPPQDPALPAATGGK